MFRDDIYIYIYLMFKDSKQNIFTILGMKDKIFNSLEMKNEHFKALELKTNF